MNEEKKTRFFYKDGVRYLYLTGYGSLSRHYLYGLLTHKDLDIFIQGSGIQFEDIEDYLVLSMARVPRHINQKEWDLTFHVMPPGDLTPLPGINFCYTQNALSKLKPDWLTVLKKMDLVIVPSNYDREVFMREGLENIEIVPQASDSGFYAPVETPPMNPFIFLNVGTFNFRKGQDILMKAFKLAFGDDPAVRLYFKTGRGEFSKYFRKMIIENGLNGNNIILDEKLTGPTGMRELYHKAHCLVTPSRGEGWALPNTEAMCCGLPVVSTKATAMLDYMTEENSFPLEAVPVKIGNHPIDWFSANWLNGYSDIPQGDVYEINPAKLAETMTYIYKNYEEARKKGMQAQKDMIEKWTWNQATEKLYEVIMRHYKLLTGEKRGIIIPENKNIPPLQYK